MPEDRRWQEFSLDLPKKKYHIEQEFLLSGYDKGMADLVDIQYCVHVADLLPMYTIMYVDRKRCEL